MEMNLPAPVTLPNGWTRESFKTCRWSGKAIEEMEVSPDRTQFKLYDYTFTLERVPRDPLPEGDDPKYEYLEYRVTGSSWPPDYTLATVGKFVKDDTWMASSFDMVREDRDPVVAAARIIANTV